MYGNNWTVAGAMGGDPLASPEYASMMSGLDIVAGLAPGAPPMHVAQPFSISAQPPTLAAAGMELMSGGLDLVSGLDIVSGAGGLDVDALTEAVVSGAAPPAALRGLPPALQRTVLNNVVLRRAAEKAATFRRLSTQPRLVDTGPRAMKEQTQNLGRTNVNAGASFPWTFTILGRAAKIYDIIVPDSIAQFFEITTALLGNDNLFHGAGAANCETFAASARRTGFESDTLPTGSIVAITFANIDTVAHPISARVKMRVMY